MAFGIIKKNKDVVKEGEVKETKKVKKEKKVKKGKEPKEVVQEEKTVDGANNKMDQPTELERTDSMSSNDSSKGMTSFIWGGGQKKKPRAEYQSEIDELKLQLAAVTTDLETANADLQTTQSELQTANSNLQTANFKLQQTTQKYDSLRRWAQSAPVH